MHLQGGITTADNLHEMICFAKSSCVRGRSASSGYAQIMTRLLPLVLIVDFAYSFFLYRPRQLSTFFSISSVRHMPFGACPT